MNATQQVSICCPRCQSEKEIVILGRKENLIVIECHSCLTLQVVHQTQRKREHE